MSRYSTGCCVSRRRQATSRPCHLQLPRALFRLPLGIDLTVHYICGFTNIFGNMRYALATESSARSSCNGFWDLDNYFPSEGKQTTHSCMKLNLYSKSGQKPPIRRSARVCRFDKKGISLDISGGAKPPPFVCLRDILKLCISSCNRLRQHREFDIPVPDFH
jgi:hypothetical protein